MLTLRQRVLVGIGILAGILIVVFLIISLVRAPKDTPETTVDNTNVIDSTTGPLIVESVTPNIVVTDTPPEAPQETYVKNIARVFVERFFTYSNQNNNDHIADVLSLATPNMQTYMQAQTKTQSTHEYNGMTTRVLTTELTNFDEGSGTATVHVGVRQTLSSRPEGNVIVEDTIELHEADVAFQYVQGEWKIAGIFWTP